MLEDVLAALAAALPGPVFVVTTDALVMEVAERYGARCLVEPANRGHTEAVAFAQREALARGAARFLTIPGDVPCVTAEEIAVVCGAAGAGVTFVPSMSGFGTNGALLAPPDAMPLKFGEPSFDNHLLAARQRGLTPVIRELPGLGLDIDTPEDLALLLARGAHTRSAALVSSWHLPHLNPNHGPGAMKRYEVIGVEGLPEIGRGDDLAGFIHETARRQQTPLESRDILVVSQKIVSKTEGRLVRLSEVTPSARAQALALELGRDPKLTEVILSESRRVVRGDKGVLIVETHHGWICANAGVDQSNVDADTACLLPEDSDRSARALRDRLRQLTGHELGIIIADTFGRPWREGLINVAVGVAGLMPLKSYLGELDPAGHVLQATILALADELASAAEPVMGKLDRIPVVIIRGLDWEAGEVGSQPLIRDPDRDLFR